VTALWGRGTKQLTICPCCGFKFEGNLIEGCKACSARAVGEPLPKPEHELPGYGRSLLVSITGVLMLLALLIETVIALAKRVPLSFGFWSWISAGETAAWRLKGIGFPVSLLVLWSSRKIYRSIMQAPTRFCGRRFARAGLTAATAVPLMIAVLIAVTVPERLRQRQLSIEAAAQVPGYTLERAFFEYRMRYGKIPGNLFDLRLLPDPDGSIATALSPYDSINVSTAYKPSADVAALPRQKPRPLRGAVIRNASVSSVGDDTLSDGLSFTNYELRLPGPDKLMGTDDDLLLRDGVIKKASEALRPTNTQTAAGRAKP